MSIADRLPKILQRLTLNLTYVFIRLVSVALADAFRYGTHGQTDAYLAV